MTYGKRLLNDPQLNEALKNIINKDLFHLELDNLEEFGDEFQMVAELFEYDYNLIGKTTIRGTISDNLIIIYNNHNNTTIVYRIESGEYIY